MEQLDLAFIVAALGWAVNLNRAHTLADAEKPCGTAVAFMIVYGVLCALILTSK